MTTIDIIIKDTQVKMIQAINYMNQEFTMLHAGQASSKVVESIMVNIYNSSTKIFQIASITIPNSRTILIQPWDKNVLKEIVKAIYKANIGLNPIIESNIIRCSMPNITKERRTELVKLTKKMTEDCRINIRNLRKNAMDVIKKIQKKNEISEDNFNLYQKEIQKITDESIEKTTKYSIQKEKKLMQI